MHTPTNRTRSVRLAAWLLAAGVVLAPLTQASAQVTFADDVLTYQGQLKRDGQPYSGSVDLRITVLNNNGVAAGPAVLANTVATGGLFTVRPDLGSFETGLPGRQLRIEVKTPGDPDFVTLTPNQTLTRAPGAVVAERSLATDAIAATSYPNLDLIVGQSERSSAPISTNPWQAFSPASNRNLTHIVIPTFTLGFDSNVRLRIYSGSGVAGTILHEQRVGLSRSGESVLALSRPVALQANTFYTWELEGQFLIPISAADAIPGASSLVGTDFTFRAYSSTFPNLLLRGNRVGVGMGTPLATLHVFGSESFNTALIESDQLAGTWLNLKNASGRTWSLVSTGTGNTEGAGELLFRDTDAGVVRMTLDGTGSLGIGTVNPDARLQVNGGGNISQNQTPFLRLGPSNDFNLAFDTNELQVRNNNNPASLFLNTLGGNVALGGGGLAPQTKLHILEGSDLTLTSGGFLTLGRNVEQNLLLDNNEIQARNNDAAATLFLNFEGGDVIVGDINNSVGSTIFAVGGNASKPGGGLWGALSDRTAKTDIKPLAGALETLLTLHGYTFQYTQDALAKGGALPGTHIGLMAQEVQPVFPDWVSVDKHGRLTVAERGTTALFVEALRDLRAEKDTEIADLKARLERLERALAERSLGSDR